MALAIHKMNGAAIWACQRIEILLLVTKPWEFSLSAFVVTFVMSHTLNLLSSQSSLDWAWHCQVSVPRGFGWGLACYNLFINALKRGWAMRRKNWQMIILFRLIKNTMDRGDHQSQRQCQTLRKRGVMINAMHCMLKGRFWTNHIHCCGLN